jgi:hypothetical protein
MGTSTSVARSKRLPASPKAAHHCDTALPVVSRNWMRARMKGESPKMSRAL